MHLPSRTGGHFLSDELAKHAQALQWRFWQVPSLGPMDGQASHHVRYALCGRDYAKRRSANKARRAVHVMAFRLRIVDCLTKAHFIADLMVSHGR